MRSRNKNHNHFLRIRLLRCLLPFPDNIFSRTVTLENGLSNEKFPDCYNYIIFKPKVNCYSSYTFSSINLIHLPCWVLCRLWLPRLLQKVLLTAKTIYLAYSFLSEKGETFQLRFNKQRKERHDRGTHVTRLPSIHPPVV